MAAGAFWVPTSARGAALAAAAAPPTAPPLLPLAAAVALAPFLAFACAMLRWHVERATAAALAQGRGKE